MLIGESNGSPAGRNRPAGSLRGLSSSLGGFSDPEESTLRESGQLRDNNEEIIYGVTRKDPHLVLFNASWKLRVTII